MTLTVGSLFSGVGGIDLGLEATGEFKVMWQVEIDMQCRSVLAAHWPEVPRYNDVQEVTGERLRADLGDRADVDVLVGGFPCTDVSVAGRREGLAGSASGLFFEFIRLAADLRPTWLLIENVDGLLSSQDGRDMGTVTGALGELGCGFAWRVLDAQYFGVPQRRKRIFFVCHLGEPWSAPSEVLLEPEGCGGDTAPLESAEQGAAAPVEDGTRDSEWIRPEADGSLSSGPSIARPVLSNSQGGQRTTDLDGVTFVANTHADTFSIFPESGQGADLIARATDLSPALTAIGYSKTTDRGVFIAQALSFNQRDEPRLSDTAYTVQAQPGSDEQLVVQAETYSVYPEGGQASDLVATETGVAPALTTNPSQTSTGGDRGLFVAAPAGTFRKSRRAHTDDDHETWLEDDVANTLNGFDTGLSRTTHTVVQDWTVRRLTPKECERLMGLPDDWTAVGADGRALYDTVRYRQLGNSVVVPVISWIGRRLAQVHHQLNRKD